MSSVLLIALGDGLKPTERYSSRQMLEPVGQMSRPERANRRRIPRIARTISWLTRQVPRPSLPHRGGIAYIWGSTPARLQVKATWQPGGLRVHSSTLECISVVTAVDVPILI